MKCYVLRMFIHSFVHSGLLHKATTTTTIRMLHYCGLCGYFPLL